ncbi:MAG: hypothetical protein BWY63_03564 [Chloroflexi bacterium ADurb.Bin360]|nr:MAG: hypothetical protein BWY63_03564 [Chloroflexi bacterium ADurb.Bin360]
MEKEIRQIDELEDIGIRDEDDIEFFSRTQGLRSYKVRDTFTLEELPVMQWGKESHVHIGVWKDTTHCLRQKKMRQRAGSITERGEAHDENTKFGSLECRIPKSGIGLRQITLCCLQPVSFTSEESAILSHGDDFTGKCPLYKGTVSDQGD